MPVVVKKTKVEDVPTRKGKSIIKRSIKDPDKKKVIPEVTAPLTLINANKDYLEVFNKPQNQTLVAQYLRVYLFNQREGNAQTKTRGAVAGSGRKPWRQKGTGRARVGSVRNPVWRHGGVSHGPVVKDWSLNFPKKMRSKVFLSAMSQKISEKSAFLINKLELSEGRTKEAKSIVDSWNLPGSVLIVTNSYDGKLASGIANLKNVDECRTYNLNPFQIISHDYLVFEKEALESLKKKYAKNN